MDQYLYHHICYNQGEPLCNLYRYVTGRFQGNIPPANCGRKRLPDGLRNESVQTFLFAAADRSWVQDDLGFLKIYTLSNIIQLPMSAWGELMEPFISYHHDDDENHKDASKRMDTGPKLIPDIIKSHIQVVGIVASEKIMPTHHWPNWGTQTLPATYATTSGTPVSPIGIGSKNPTPRSTR